MGIPKYELNKRPLQVAADQEYDPNSTNAQSGAAVAQALAAIAPAWSQQAAYNPGDLVMRNGKIWRALHVIASGTSWAAADWEEVDLNDFLQVGQVSLAEEITYSALVALRNGGNLVPGKWYRITDYRCSTLQAETQAATHYFDILVRSDDESHINENAFAAHHEGDTYFQNSKLEAWKLKYCLDNDINRFGWADDSDGRGVIYYMKDECGNECPYDFKNILFVRHEKDLAHFINGASYAEDDGDDATAALITSVANRLKADSSWATSVWAKYGYENTTTAADISDLLDFLSIQYEDDDLYSYIYENEDYYGVLAPLTSNVKNCYTFHNPTGDVDGSLLFSNNIYGNKIEPLYSEGVQKLNNIVFFGANNYASSFGHNCSNNTFGNYCNNNTFGNYCGYNSFGNNCGSNSFGNNCYRNSSGNYFQYNSFGNSCYNNSFGNSCNNNSFGNGCNSNSFGNNFQYNSFGNDCYKNSFGNDCYGNSFGNDCYKNSFGNSCNNNSFGNSCNSNSFGNGCYSNSFGNSCNNNSFGNNCGSNSFGNSCNSNSFGNYFQYNSFGNYIRQITVFDGVQYCSVTGGSSNSYVQNAQILNGTAGEDGDLLTIAFDPGESYTQVACFNSSGSLTVFCPADSHPT